MGSFEGFGGGGERVFKTSEYLPEEYNPIEYFFERVASEDIEQPKTNTSFQPKTYDSSRIQFLQEIRQNVDFEGRYKSFASVRSEILSQNP